MLKCTIVLKQTFKLFIIFVVLGNGKSKLSGSQTSLEPPQEDWTICTR